MEAALTKEHVYPRWISDVLGTRTWPASTDGAGRGQAPPFAQTVRAVCRECNNGWLAALESDAKGILAPTITGGLLRDGNQWLLDPTTQMVIGTWVFKTCLMMDLAMDIGVFELDAGRWLNDARRPPPTDGIWIGGLLWEKHISSTWSCGHQEIGFPSLHFPNEPAYGHSITFSLGHLVVQQMGHDGPESVSLHHAGEGHTLLRVWPTQDENIAWPPPILLDEPMLTELSKLHPGGNTVHIPPPRRWKDRRA